MLQAALRRAAELEIWGGPVSPEPLPGGISNHNFLVEDGGRRYVVRVGEDAPEHAVYRFNEVTVSIAAHAAGLSPGVVHHEADVLVLEYLEGARTLTPEDIRDPSNMERLIGLIGRCHMDLPGYLEVPGPMFWVFQVNRRYARIIAESDARGRERLSGWMAVNDDLEALAGAINPVFCHNDLLAANILDDGDRLWLIDWEYGAWNSALFDLANMASNSQMPPAQEAELLARYSAVQTGGLTAESYAAMRCASLLREALWSLVSEQHSAVDFDYVAYSEDYLARFDRAVAELKSQDLL
tara:strand:- start:359 stop:1249 length:891 start_codon:yes stop_codon:yes gene_type:complete